MTENVFLKYMGDQGRERALASGETLFHRDDSVTHLYVVSEGCVRLLRHTAEGRTVTFQTATPGDTLAEASLHAPRYHCDAVAERESIVIQFSKKLVIETLADDAKFAADAMAVLARQLIDTRWRLELRNIRSAKERILQYLYLCCDDSGCVTLTQPLKQIAGEIGLTHEALYRALSALAKEGAIERFPESGQIKIL